MQFFIDFFFVFFVEKTYVVACAIVIIYNIIDKLSLSIDDHQKRQHIDDHSHYYYQVATIMIVLKKNIISIFISHTKPKTNDTGNS